MIGFFTALFLGAAIALKPVPPRARLGTREEDVFTLGTGAFSSERPDPPLLRTFAATVWPKHSRDGPLANPDRHRIASDIELFAACFRAGLPAATAAAAVSASYGDDVAEPAAEADPVGDRWRRVVAYTSLGMEPEQAWTAMDGVPGCEELASLVTLSHASGSAVADGCARIVASLRDDAADDATAAAERAGVLISIPLAVFFLPAFFVLGLAPVVVGLGTEMFGG